MPTVQIHPNELLIGDLLEYGGVSQRVSRLSPLDNNRTMIETTLPSSLHHYDEIVVKNSTLLTITPNM